MSNIYSSSDVIKLSIESIFKNVSSSKMQNANKIFNAWKSTLLSIKNNVNPDCGQNMLDHSNILDIQNKTMIIEVDHPGWMQMFETYKKYILRGMEMKIPEVNIKSISYKLKRLEYYELKTEKKIEKTNEDDNKIENIKDVEMPQELKSIFDSFRKIILTNE